MSTENIDLINTLALLEMIGEKCQARGWYSFGGGEKGNGNRDANKRK
jgi:hypothetical protein